MHSTLQILKVHTVLAAEGLCAFKNGQLIEINKASLFRFRINYKR